MVSQIFKNNIPQDMLITLLHNIGLKTNKCYTINKYVYKKGLFTEHITNFVEECTPYYYESKRKYVNPPITYSSFVTIIRQICNANKIKYTYQVKYDKNNYDIIYSIFIVDQPIM